MYGFHDLWETVYMKMESEPEDAAAAAAARQRGSKLKEDKVCGVCGDRALGYNFDAISCESCKAFFRRNAPKGLDYFKCPYDEKCKMDVSNRRFCKRCRLRKCFDIGMRKEYILTEEERMRKRQKIEENRRQRELEKGGSIGGSGGYLTGGSSIKENRDNSSDSMSSNECGYGSVHGLGDGSPLPLGGGSSLMAGGASLELSSTTCLSPPYAPSSSSSSAAGFGSGVSCCPLQHDDLLLIDELQRSYRSSLDVCVGTLQPRDQSKTALPDLINVAEVSIRRVIDMSKKIRSFKQLPQATQITLLKGGSIELLIIRSVLTYDKDKQLFLDARDNPNTSSMTLEEFKSAATKSGPGGGLGGFGAPPAAAAAFAAGGLDPAAAGGLVAMRGYSLVEDMMRFVRSLAIDLCADETVLILLLVISLFSPDRPHLDSKDVVAREQERYSMLLLRYLESRHPPLVARALFPKLLMKLTDIRNLNEESSQVFLNMNAENIQPLMKEVLDLPPVTPPADLSPPPPSMPHHRHHASATTAEATPAGGPAGSMPSSASASSAASGSHHRLAAGGCI